MIVIIDGPMISRFIEDSEAFNRCADERFDLIEQNRRQKVKSDESTGLDSEDYCDDNQSENVDREKFRAELRAAMAAVAEGIGKTLVNVVVDEGSFMTKVYEAEVARIEKEKENMKKKKIEMMNGKQQHGRKSSHDDEEKKEREYGEIASPKKLKKRRSMKFLSFCACSGKYYDDNS